jgi:23S rRNA pseudouridine1911/1915/1917 synthase
VTELTDEGSGVESFDVPLEGVGLRLDVVLSRLIEFIPSRAFAQKLIECGAVRVSGKPRRASWKVLEGEKIEIDVGALRPAPSIPGPQKIDLDIIFEDEDILVVNKPAGLVVHPGAGVPDGTLVNAVLAHTGATLPSLGEPSRAGLVHRLDRDTSGVMVVAKSQRALTELAGQFARHTQLRRYRALVFGTPEPVTQDIETWHGRDPKNRLKFAVLPEGQGKIAKMRMHVDTVFAEGLASAVTCELFTGRTHQIRVQMSHLKHGLLGDIVYGQGAMSAKSEAAPLMRDKRLWPKVCGLAHRHMLHAAVLGLTHPRTGEALLFESEPPEDFKRLEEFLTHAIQNKN